MEKAILDQNVKLCVTKEAEIKDNICKMHDKIWGKFTDTLQSMIAHEKRYEEKERNKDLFYLLKTIKEILSGLDKLVSKHVTYYNSLKSCVLKLIGKTESEDSYVKIFHSIIKTLIPDGRKGDLCCIKTLVAK